ncbi:rhodanese-like domain-containing protein [Cerasicoccus arenae]|uniref:Sulfurtransferase n=1 Tax=Cerasicoccus arenae TaxID=424488 RepID=A0A8J3GD19_9BACT|nr:rhodanese-like domain-containing protein [Cerasicoccus arenae]MBK1857130.1 rhodanese-like domain-containing protein [Cerasicoccus arenae]GHB92537.1 sulfurtransferase [Cerasicoccus arenae]
MNQPLILGALALLLHATPGIAQITILNEFLLASANPTQPIPNELIDAQGFVEIVTSSQDVREKNRLTEEEFLQAINSGEYILLDARSAANYELRHIQGAVNLPFTEFTAETLMAIIPDSDTKVLIYCNNNFLNSPRSFASKSVLASLNLNTQASLRAYGYENIYELGPLLDVNNTRLPFSGTEVE